jgi:glycosyltransferase involved in cell wall biosynthesis
MAEASSRTSIVVLAHDTDSVARCLLALPADLTLLAGGSPAGRDALERLARDRNIDWLEADGAAFWNRAAEAVGGDLVLLDSRTELPAAALDGLVAAAWAEPDAATLTPLSNDAAFLSVPKRNVPWPLVAGGLTPEDAARRVAEHSLGLHPRLPTALPHATLVRRSAIELVGSFDESLEPREALADFSARAIAAGLHCVLADEVFVAHRGEPGGPQPDAWLGPAAARHPALHSAVQEAAWDRRSALSRSLLTASVVLEPLSVTIDARNLAGSVTGTTVHLAGLIGALSARADVAVRALLPDSLDRDVEAMLSGIAGLERLSAGAIGEVVRTHVAHRPWQAESLEDAALLDRLGERSVITHQDLIGYRTPQVFQNADHWHDYRRTTRDSLALASIVLFFSEAAARDAAADDLVDIQRVRVAALGTDAVAATAVEPRCPAKLEQLQDRPLLVMIGRRFRHKNVRFALELLAELRSAQGWDGELVLAGSEVLHGSGSADDAAWLLSNDGLGPHVHELGSVDEGEKAWLLQHAAALVYPSTYEGFGLVPFEAAEAGVPCLFAAVSAMAETLPSELALIEPWNAVVSAERARAVLTDESARAEHVSQLRRAAAAMSWERTAELVVAAYHDAVRLPSPSAARLTDDLQKAESAYWQLRDGVSEPKWALVDPQAPLLDEDLARALSAQLRAGGQRSLSRWLSARRAVRRLSPRTRP